MHEKARKRVRAKKIQASKREREEERKYVELK